MAILGPVSAGKSTFFNALMSNTYSDMNYATMDGDTCGGLSPIAGIDKAFLRHWLRWLETDGPVGMQPIHTNIHQQVHDQFITL